MKEIGFLYSIIRIEEKLLLEEARKQRIKLQKIEDKKMSFNLGKKTYEFDTVFDRSIAHTRTAYIIELLESQGTKCINSSEIIKKCGDKIITSNILSKKGINTPKTVVAFDTETALQEIEAMGYPVVLKPVIGSWGRLMAKISDRNSAEAVLEHKIRLNSPIHNIFYIQKFVEKPGRDIRAYVIGGETVAAIYRHSNHWITNTARGGKAENCRLTSELKEICVKAANAIGEGILSIDLMEDKNGLTVHEINHTTEFRNSIKPTKVNLPKLIIEYVYKEAKK